MLEEELDTELERQARDAGTSKATIIRRACPCRDQATVHLARPFPCFGMVEREYSFLDATSFVVMKAARTTPALAFDGDFSAAGFVELRPE